MKKHTRAIALSLFFILALGTFTGCTPGSAKEKTFSKAGMSITLTDAFSEKDLVSQTAYYESASTIVTVLKEEFTLFESAGLSADMTLSEYAEVVIYGNSIDSTVETKEGIVCFSYEKQISGKDFAYFATVFRGSDAYWLIQFACEKKNYDSQKEQFLTWAKTVKV